MTKEREKKEERELKEYKQFYSLRKKKEDEEERSQSGEAVLVAAEEVLGLGVLEGAAGDEVDPDKDDQGDDEDHVRPPPLLPHTPQQAGLARRAPVAELGRIVAPRPAVGVRPRVRRIRPHRRPHVPVPAHQRRLAAPRLQQIIIITVKTTQKDSVFV